MLSLANFKATLIAADPTARKFRNDSTGNYTIWTPVRIVTSSSDDGIDDKYWIVQIDRFTRLDDDPVVDAIYNALEAARIPFDYLIDVEPEKGESGTGYIHHIYDCRVR